MNSQYNSLTAFAQEIERIEATKHDYVCQSRALCMVDDHAMMIDAKDRYNITEYAHGQLATKLGIPKAYYDRMIAAPNLRSYNVNAWLDKSDSRILVRTLDDKARAFLSDRYRPVDNYLILNAFLPAIKDAGAVKVRSSCLGEKRMYIQVTFPTMQAEIKKGDVVEYGITLTNSEVGAGAVDIKRCLWRLVCSNGLIRESVLRRHHIGKKIDTDSDESYDLYKDDTITAELESLRLRMRDVIVHELGATSFMEEVEKLRHAASDQIISVTKTVEEVTKRYMVSPKHQDFIINNMVSENNLNRWGLANSITALAKQFDSADMQYEYEKLGSKIIDLSPKDWSLINEAA